MGSLATAVLTILLSQQATPAPASTPSPSPTPAPSKVTVIVGEPGEKWPVSGTADLADDTALQVAIRRFERFWNPGGTFGEKASEEKRNYMTAPVKSRAYRVEFRPVATGFYELEVSSKADQLVLHRSRASFGRIEKLFTGSRDKVRRILDIIAKVEAGHGEILQIHKKLKPPSTGQRDDFIGRVTTLERDITDLGRECDLTATLALLKDACFHLRNAQVWNTAGGGGEPTFAQGDKAVDPNIVLADIESKLKEIRHVLSLELRLSIASLIDDRFERAGTDAKKLAKVREAAKEGRKLAEDAPEKDEDFVKLIDKASEAADEKDLATVREDLKACVTVLLPNP